MYSRDIFHWGEEKSNPTIKVSDYEDNKDKAVY